MACSEDRLMYLLCTITSYCINITFEVIIIIASHFTSDKCCVCTCKWYTGCSLLVDLSLGFVGSLNTGATNDTCVNADLGKNGLNKYNVVFLYYLMNVVII